MTSAYGHSAEPQAVTVAAGAQNTFTDAIQVSAGEKVAISIDGTFVATVKLQRKLRGQSDFRNIDSQSWTAAAETEYEMPESGELRLGVPTGGYTSGTVNGRLGKG